MINWRKKLRFFDIRDWLVASVKWRRWGFLDICPTWKCNARCPTCNCWQRERDELNDDQAFQLVNHPYFKHINAVTIEGGEPTMWSHLDFFIGLFLSKKSYPLINIITNGFKYSFLYELGEKFIENKHRIKFYVSLNGDKETHDASRGVKNAYERTIKSIEILKNLGYFVQLSSVMFDQNIDKLDHVFDIAKIYNCPVNVCWPTTYGRFEHGGLWTTNRKEEILAAKEKVSSKLRWLDQWAYDYFLYRASNSLLMPCYAGYRYVHVNPQGVLRPCLFDESMVIGQVYNDDVELFDFKKTVKRIPDKCQYKDGGLCDDCLVRKSVRSNIPRVLWGKLWSL